MNPIRTATGLITLPAHAAVAVVRAGVRVVGWGFDHLTGPSAPPARSPWSPEVVRPAAAVPTVPVREAPAKKAPAKKASSRKAAVLAPALGMSEAEVEDQIIDKG